MIRLYSALFLFLLNCTFIAAQNTDSTTIEEIAQIPPYHYHNYGITLGYRGFNQSIGEIGVTRMAIGHGVEGIELNYLSNFKSGKDHLSGYAIGFYRGFAIFEIGINSTLYTNYSQSSFYSRPYLGFGMGGFLTGSYGYNIPFGPNHFKSQINKHELRIILRWAFER